MFWVAESGAITESESTFDSVTLSPKTAGALSKMSRLTLLQTSPDIEQLTRDDLLATMGVGIDLACSPVPARATSRPAS
jgi:HK97 family phage major capsid protein